MANLNAVSATPKEATLTERLNRVHDTLAYQADRLESVLSRVNSTPQSDGTAKVPANPQYGLADIVDRLENQAKRVISLCDGVERIA